ncbi:hypothetical protein OSB04_020549 [Centaurea solstitialis]|uniref:Pantoate--beta-alanine ligase n=1 Tax=Centaurea solstitialis TaxID=347529 RepID=A0AA38T3V2_9ASTR|nr:hypothetical protein OSB04_020549 [Centaurea solstitialis]
MAIRDPEIIRDKQQMRNWSRSMRSQGKTIGLVPTMGYLHQGHLSLIAEARKHAQLIVVSIYVNPGQFSATEDLSTYPSDFHGDIEKLKSINGGVDVVFNPKDLYDYGGDRERSGGNEVEREGGVVVSCLEDGGGGHETWIRVERLEKGMCGRSRPVFFRGVATVVAKLFNVVEPDVAVFGKKDYQQWRIVQRMVRDLDFGVKVIGAEMIRDEDGLAMSSRNVHLSPQERGQALSISRSLFEAKSAAKGGKTACSELRRSVIESIEAAGGKIDYVEIVDQESLEAVEEIKGGGVVVCVAAWFGKVRLIDNMEIHL